MTDRELDRLKRTLLQRLVTWERIKVETLKDKRTAYMADNRWWECRRILDIVEGLES